MREFRFSLLTLMLYCVWLAALTGVYLRRDSWEVEPRIYSESAVIHLLPNWRASFLRIPVKSPDGMRLARTSSNYAIEIASLNESGVIARLETNRPGGDPIRFVDDSTLIIG